MISNGRVCEAACEPMTVSKPSISGTRLSRSSLMGTMTEAHGWDGTAMRGRCSGCRREPTCSRSAFYRMPGGASNHAAGSASRARRASCERGEIADLTDSSSLAGLPILAFRARPAILLTRRNCEAHRTHQAHLADLFSHVDFHFVPAGLPRALWRGEC